MRWYKADLHLHGVLSPCGSLEMSPTLVAQKAIAAGLDIIALTDHNTLANCPAYQAVASKYGLTLLWGVEVQSSEEIHIVGLFDDHLQAIEFDKLLYASLLPISNDPDFFGDQPVINEHEEIVRLEERALINSSMWSFDEVIQNITAYGGFAFPAHVDAASYSVIGQLGFIPPGNGLCAVGITAKCDAKALLAMHPWLSSYTLLRNTDAHYPNQIGQVYNSFYLAHPTVAEITMACQGLNNRKIKVKQNI